MDPKDGLLLVREEIMGWKLHQNQQITTDLRHIAARGGTQCNNLISFRGKRIYKRTLIQMRPELQQEYEKHQNQGGMRSKPLHLREGEQEDERGRLTSRFIRRMRIG